MPVLVAVTGTVALVAVAMIVAAGWQVIVHHESEGWLLSALAGLALLLVALMVLIGWRIAHYRAGKAGVAAHGGLHVRLVALFSLIASVPIVLTVIVASVMFQSGTQFWLSDRAHSAFSASIRVAEEGRNLVAQRWGGEARTLTNDIQKDYPERLPLHSPEFQNWFELQTYFRNLEQSVLFLYEPGKPIQPLYSFHPPPDAVFLKRVNGPLLDALKPGHFPYVTKDDQVIWVLVDVPGSNNLFLYAATHVDVEFLNKQAASVNTISREYETLLERAPSLQLQFNIVLFLSALLIIGVAIAFALMVADRLVRPIDALVIAARRVAAGDLAARVPEPAAVRDEIGTLGHAFNQMTDRLQEQTGDLVAANAQVESRRALLAAVLSGVSAGVISIGADRTVRLANASATLLLKAEEAALIGRPLAEIAPELAALLDGDAREAIVQFTSSGEARTLAVKITKTGDRTGQVLTFDDITQQLLDQRRAAWSDVARRIAHEIKNPLTPIQLAAERIQRRYGRQIDPADTVFTSLTGTIVRQVGDLRRMVDEFSSFARMPKPVFRQESLVDLARQTLLLHEVAHPQIRFTLEHGEPPPLLVCDRRQIGQALVNIVKNAVEAIEAKAEQGESGGAGQGGEVVMTLGSEGEHRMSIRIADNGIGLPLERERIVEPYMTTRSRGTGLGLAIVKKIVEEHFGTIGFADRPGGGTIVTLSFDTALLANLVTDTPESETEDRLANLTRTGASRL